MSKQKIDKKPLHQFSMFAEDEQRWLAVQNRDANADGSFVYAVKTTKIYCRPICKARLARRANVGFYQTGLEAQKAGFRACKRCKPELEGNMPEEAAVRKIKAFIESHTTEDHKPSLSLSQMAKQTGLSKWHFHRVFKKCAGMTPTEFLRSQSASALQLNTPPLTDDEFGWFSPVDFGDAEEFGFGLSLNTEDTWGWNAGVGDGLQPFTYDELMVWPEIPNQGV